MEKTLYFIAATWTDDETVVLDDCDRWSFNPGRRKHFTKFGDAEKAYRRLMEFGTRAVNVLVIGE